jgi:DNA/RNA-binding domain of Phe-tRNA-synthetase-like protein
MNRCATLPDGRTLRLDDGVLGALRAGALAVDGVTVREGTAVRDDTAALGARLWAEHAGRIPSDIPGLREARDLYNAFGMEPTRHRPSSEALLRRVLQGKDLYRLNNVVDTCNLASLEFLLPIGLYDRDLVRGDVTLRLGRAGEEYPGIRKGPVHLAGRLALFDDGGGFGSPTSDSQRTCVHAGTTRLLAVIMSTRSVPREAMRARVSRFGELLVRHCGGEVTFAGLLDGGP